MNVRVFSFIVIHESSMDNLHVRLNFNLTVLAVLIMAIPAPTFGLQIISLCMATPG